MATGSLLSVTLNSLFVVIGEFVQSLFRASPSFNSPESFLILLSAASQLHCIMPFSTLCFPEICSPYGNRIRGIFGSLRLSQDPLQFWHIAPSGHKQFSIPAPYPAAPHSPPRDTAQGAIHLDGKRLLECLSASQQYEEIAGGDMVGSELTTETFHPRF
jgi:hypothetical protein